MAGDKPRDGFFSKVLVATVVVIWLSLVGGNWLGRYAVARGYIGKKGAAERFRKMPAPEPHPWVKVAPSVQRLLRKLRKSGHHPSTNSVPKVTVTATPVAGRAHVPAVAATPRVAHHGHTSADHALKPTPTPEATPQATSNGYQLQFGAFARAENARRLVAKLKQKGQSASVEEIDTADGKVYRVRGASFRQASDARTMADSLKEQGIQVFVVSQ